MNTTGRICACPGCEKLARSNRVGSVCSIDCQNKVFRLKHPSYSKDYYADNYSSDTGKDETDGIKVRRKRKVIQRFFWSIRFPGDAKIAENIEKISRASLEDNYNMHSPERFVERAK